MIGTWKGFYKYDKQGIQDKIGFDRTNFTIYIDSFENNKFKGKAEDDIFTGGMPGVGRVKGTVKAEKVRFIKIMPSKSPFNKPGEPEIYKDKYLSVIHEGTFSEDKKTIKGIWNIKFQFAIISFILLLFPTKGTWQIDFVDKNN